MDKREIVKKRIRNPLFKYYGNVTQSSLNTLSKLFSSTDATLSTAMKLRSLELSESIGYYEEKYLEDYDQYDIQLKQSDAVDSEGSYTITPDDFMIVRDEVSYLLQSPVCRMRYATLEVDSELEYHIDQPGKDRFIMVVEGEQAVYIKDKAGVHIQVMKPGEVWYINSNWEHKVDNIGKQQRLALLGCFEYNNT